MTLKKGILDQYIKERELSSVPITTPHKSKYSQNRIFDEPDSLNNKIDDTLAHQNELNISDTTQNICTNISVDLTNSKVSTLLNQSSIPQKHNTQASEAIIISIAENDEPNSNEFNKSQLDLNQSTSIGFNKVQPISLPSNSTGFNRIQSVSYPSTSIGFNGIQSASPQSASMGFNELQSVSPQQDSIGLNRIQSVSQSVSKLPSISELKILYFFHENLNEQGVVVIQRKAIIEATTLTLAGVKTALTRLKKKGYIELVSCSSGRYTGYTSYILLAETYKILSTAQARELLGFKRLQSVSQSVSIEPISSNINTTTNLPVEWQKINIEPLSEIGFAHTHLKQLVDKNQPELVQASINHFSYALSNNPKFKEHPNPLNVIIGVLRKGNVWIESTYRSPQEIAQEELIRYKEIESERFKKIQEKFFDLAYIDWEKKLTKEEKEKIIASNTLNSKRNVIPENVTLRIFFKENVWPAMQKITA